MIQNKKQTCKGQRKAKSFPGCKEPKYIYRYGLCQKCFIEWSLNTPEGKANLEKQKIKVKSNMKREEKKELQDWKKKVDGPRSEMKKSRRLADDYFSQYIRLLHSFEQNGDLYCRCYTTGIVKHIKDIDNGHFISREEKSTRFHEDNCRPQSKFANKYKYGQHSIFRQNLIEEIGIEKVESLEKQAKQGYQKESVDWYKEIAEKYRSKRNELQKNIGIKIW